MLPELTKLKITAVHCEHLSTHLVTGDGREDALVRRTISDDLNHDLHAAYRHVQDRPSWRKTVETAMLI